MQSSRTANYDEDDIARARRHRKCGKQELYRRTRTVRQNGTGEGASKMAFLEKTIGKLAIDNPVDFDTLQAMTRYNERTGNSPSHKACLACARHLLSNYAVILKRLVRNDMMNYTFIAKLAVLALCAQTWPELRCAAGQIAYDVIDEQFERGNNVVRGIQYGSGVRIERINWRIWE